MSDIKECAKCGRVFDTSDDAGLVKLAYNRGDGKPRWYCCVTMREAVAMLADFESVVMRGDKEDAN